MPYNALHTRHLHDQLVRQTVTVCPERHDLDQNTPAGFTPCQASCTVCGRGTARRDDAGRPWCGGDPITHERWAVELGHGRFLPPAQASPLLRARLGDEALARLYAAAQAAGKAAA